MPTILLPSHVKHVSYTRRTRTFTWLIALMLLVGLTVPHTSTAQSIWSSPFDSGPEDEEDTYSTWGTPNDASTYSNPWGSDEEDDDSWGYNPWATGYDDPWDTSYDRSGGSDWSSDFYDFDDERSGSSDDGSIDPAGDGPMMASSACQPECSGNDICCISDDGSTACRPTGACDSAGGPGGVVEERDCLSDDPPEECATQCDDNPDSDACQGFCQRNPNDPDCQDVDIVPVDGALLYLVIIGVAYGAYKLRGL